MINNCSIVNSPKYEGAKVALSDLLQSENAAVAAMVKNNGELHLAPNGKPSKLFADALEIGKQLKEADVQKFAATIKAITLSNEFKEWFKDSKVIDENGEPLIVWHRSGSEFDTFDLNKSTKDTASIGFHFGTEEASQSVEIPGAFKTFEYPVFLNLKNPLECSDEYANTPIKLLQEVLKVPDNVVSEFRSFDKFYEKQERSDYIGKILRNLGYDGLTYINTSEDRGSRSFVAFQQSQIKSIQNTTFKDNKNIFYSRIYKEKGFLPIDLIVYAGQEVPYTQVEQFLQNSDIYYYFKERKSDLLPIIQNIKFEVANIAKDWRDLTTYEEFGQRPAYYDAATNTIRINPNANFPADVSEVLWHEIFHALTVNQLATNQKAYDYFYDILTEYKQSGSQIASEFNGEQAVEEFVASIWTDLDVIRELKGIKTSYKQSLWSRIKNWISKYFGFTSHTSLFVTASAALDRILELPIIQGSTSNKFFHSAERNEQNILRLLQYQYKKEGLSPEEVFSRLKAYLQGDALELNRAKKFLDYIQLRRAELHQLGRDFGSEKKNSNGTIDWESYLHNIDLRKEINEDADISTFAELKDYKIEPAEIIIPKIYKSNFKLGNQNLTDIDVNYFKKTNPYYSSNLEKTFPNSIDILVRTHSSKFNIVFTNQFSGKEFTKTLQKLIPKIEDGWRLDAAGNRMYRLPEDLDYELYTDPLGEETLLIKGTNEEVVNKGMKLINSVENKVSIQLFANNIEPSDSIILDTISANNIKTNNSALRQLLKIPSDKRVEALKQIYISQEKQYKNDLANTLYNSFVKSLYMMSVRIPTQHLQSIMAAKVVELTNDEDNNIFVNRWQFWLQGSDLDIDKSYLMGTDISSIGTYNHWSPLADYTTTELAQLSDQLPFPTGAQLKVEVTNNYDYTETLLSSLADPDEKLTKASRLKAYANLLNFAKKHNNTIYVNFDQVNNKIINQVIKDLNKHNTHKLTAEESRNVIQHLIIQTSLDERNMKSSYSPIDDAMDLFKRVLKKMDDPTALSRNLDDGMLTIARIQYNNSVGKDDVGVMANGLKAFFALTQYFNTFRKDPNFINSSKPFRKLIKINDKAIEFCTISDIKFEQEAIKALIAGLQAQGAVDPQTEIRFANDDAGLLISSLISLATDNAKELALAKMNASIDLACMHLYLAILGCNAKEIVDFATTPEFKELAKKVNRSILLKNSASVQSVLKDWLINGLHQDPEAIINIQNKFDSKYSHVKSESILEAIESKQKTAITVLETEALWTKMKDLKEGDWIQFSGKSTNTKETATKYVKITKINKLSEDQNFSIQDWCKKEGYDEKYFNDKIKPNIKKAWQIEFTTETSPYMTSNLQTINTVWMGAQEVTKLAKLASVNQGVKVDILESTKFIDNFENLLPDAFEQNQLFVPDIKDVNPALFNKVIKYNLGDPETGQLKPINAARYFKDADYRQTIVGLYEMVKETFNIFDVINTLPHFYKMLEAFVISQNTLRELSSRSRTVLGDTAGAYRQHNINTIVTTTYYDDYLGQDVVQRKKAFNKIPFSEKIYNKANKFYDDAIVSEWLKENGENYEIDYTDEEDQTRQIIPTTNKGVIDFCNFIAYTLIPELQAVYPNNGFLQHIIPNFKRVKNSKNDLWLPSYKFDFDIDSLLTVQDENKSFYVQKGFAELGDVTMEDLDLEISAGQRIPVTELIYLYNKLISFSGYGQNTLDAAFDNYLQKQFIEGNPTIAQSFSQLILEHDLKQREEVRIDPIKFLAFCYLNEIRRFQKGVMHYDYDRSTKTDSQFNISDVYLFGLEEDSEVYSKIQDTNWQNDNVEDIVEISPNNSNIDYNLLARNISQIIIEKNGNYYTLKSTNSDNLAEFTFEFKDDLTSFTDILKAAYNVDKDGLKNFLQEINDTSSKPKPLASYQSVQVYKTFAKWMQDKFNIPVELILADKNIQGKVENGIIKLNLNSDITSTPIHELMHIVFEFMKQQDFNTFERIVNNLTSSQEAQQILQQLLQDPEYSNLMNLDLLSEVSCRILENMESGKTSAVLSAEISETIMNNIAEMLGLSTNNRDLDLLSFLKDTISNLPAYNSLLLAPLKGDHSQTYKDRVNKITEGMKKTNIIKRAIQLGKLIETEC